MSGWDKKLLEQEMESIPQIDMSGFGFDDLPALNLDDGGYYGDFRETTNRQYNLDDFNPARAAGRYQMPVIEPTDYVPQDLQGFNYVLNKPDPKKGIHFFIDDYQFERIWREPGRYIEKLKPFPCVLTPDFSLYMDMPLAMKIWNIYRSRLIGQMMQDAGITVIPTLSWAEPETFDFCFDGLRAGGTVAVSTVGVMRSKEAQKIWSQGMDEALRRLKPDTVLVYGTPIKDYLWQDQQVKYIKSREGWK